MKRNREARLPTNAPPGLKQRADFLQAASLAMLETLLLEQPPGLNIELAAMVTVFSDDNGDLGVVPSLAGPTRRNAHLIAETLRKLADQLDAGIVHTDKTPDA